MAEIFSLVIGSLALPQVALQAQALFESRQQKERQVELTQVSWNLEGETFKLSSGDTL